MGSRLCFDCFEKVDDTAEKCENCGALITDKIQVASKFGGKLRTVGVETDYDNEVERLEKISEVLVGDSGHFAQMRQKDLYKISIITSILGLLQIYLAGLLDSINEVSVLFGEDKIVDGLPLMISGFAYFTGIVGFYFKFNLMRRVYLLINVVHLWILYRVYASLSFFTFLIKNFNTSNFPIQMKEFLDDIVLLQYLMFVFALFYVTQIIYMYRRELETLRYR